MPGRSFAELASFTVRRLGDYGIEIPVRSRLASMRDVLTLSDGRPRAESRYTAADAMADEALRDFQRIGFALEVMERRSISRTARTTLVHVLEEAVLRRGDSTDIHGSDAPFKLYVAAICMNAGLPTILDEPDVQCELDGVAFGIVVERIHNPTTFRAQIATAVERIGRQRFPGVVFADVSRFSKGPIDAGGDDLDDEAHRVSDAARIRVFFDSHQAWSFERFARTSAIGLIVSDHRVPVHPTTGYEPSTLTMRVDIFPPPAFAAMEFGQFFKRFALGLTARPA